MSRFNLERVFEIPLTEILDKIKRERASMVADWVDYEDKPLREESLGHFIDKSCIMHSELMGRRQLLGKAVSDNILFFDPVEGVFGVQGKSLQWGIKRYFGS